MNIGQLDAAIRAGAVGTILLLAWLLFSARRRVGLPAALFAPLALCLSGFIIGNTPIAALSRAGIVGTIAHTASGFAVVFLWWFCLSCFDSRFRLRGGGLLGVALAWAAIAAVDRRLLGDALAGKGLSLLLVPMGFAIVGHLVWRLLAERQADLIQQRHDARIMVAVLLGGMLFIDLAADALFGFAWRPLAFAMTQNAMALAFTNAALPVAALYCAFFAVIAMAFPGGRSSSEEIAFQLTIPGLEEEPFYRGILLFALDQAFTGRKRFLGIDWGWGAVLSCFLFGMAHAFGFSHSSFSFDPITMALTAIPSFIAVWMRLRTGSLPILLHNFGNSFSLLA